MDYVRKNAVSSGALPKNKIGLLDIKNELAAIQGIFDKTREFVGDISKFGFTADTILDGESGGIDTYYSFMSDIEHAVLTKQKENTADAVWVSGKEFWKFSKGDKNGLRFVPSNDTANPVIDVWFQRGDDPSEIIGQIVQVSLKKAIKLA